MLGSGRRFGLRPLALAGLVAGFSVADPASARAQAPFSVEDVLSYSFASGLVASPWADRVAWLENREGARNVWIAECGSLAEWPGGFASFVDALASARTDSENDATRRG